MRRSSLFMDIYAQQSQSTCSPPQRPFLSKARKYDHSIGQSWKQAQRSYLLLKDKTNDLSAPNQVPIPPPRSSSSSSPVYDMEKKKQQQQLKRVVQQQQQHHRQFNLYRIVSQKLKHTSSAVSNSGLRADSRESDKRNLVEYLDTSRSLNQKHQAHINHISQLHHAKQRVLRKCHQNYLQEHTTLKYDLQDNQDEEALDRAKQERQKDCQRGMRRIAQSLKEEKCTWVMLPQAQGILPSCRHSHSMQCLSDGQMVVILGQQSAPEKRVYVYDHHHHSWTAHPLLSSYSAQINRTAFGCVTIHDTIYLVQGEEMYDAPSFDKRVFDDILSLTSSASGFSADQVQIQRGTSMPPRKHMSACALFNRFILIYGGMSSAQRYLNSCYVFDTVRLFWTEVTLTGATIPLAMASMVPVFSPEDNTTEWRRFTHLNNKQYPLQGVFLFGGLNKDGYVQGLRFLEIGAKPKMRVLDTLGYQPCARIGHVMVHFESLNKLILYGGKDSQQNILDDIYLFEMGHSLWTRLTLQPGPITKQLGHTTRCFHSALINPFTNTSLVVFGGYNTHNFLPNTLMALEFDQANRLVRPNKSCEPLRVVRSMSQNYRRVEIKAVKKEADRVERSFSFMSQRTMLPRKKKQIKAPE